MQTVSDSIHSYMSKLKTMPPKQTVFSAKKQKILQELNRPEEEYTDLSPIGAVDPNIRQLVNQINEAEGYVTTSSCAGRISVFLEGAGNVKIDIGNHHNGNDDDHDTGSTNISSSSSQQGKGGGKWLFVSHDPVNLTGLEEEGKLLELFQLPNGGNAENSFSATAPPPQVKVRFVHFKFEPMVSGSFIPPHTQHIHSYLIPPLFPDLCSYSSFSSTSLDSPHPHLLPRLSTTLSLLRTLGGVSRVRNYEHHRHRANAQRWNTNTRPRVRKHYCLAGF